MSGAHGHAHGHSHAHGHGQPGTPLAVRAALASSGVALLLAGLKLWATWQTGSAAMLGSLADTALDLVASLVTLFAVRYAAQPADDEHRFGHGKAEALSALFQVALISVSAAGLMWTSIVRLTAPQPTAELELGIGVSAAAMLVTVALLAYQRWTIARTRSVAIAADHVHYQSDLLLNAAVIAALLLDQALGLTGADAAFGIAIALWLAWGAWRASVQAVDQLMDREWPLDRRQAFLDEALKHPQLAGIHDLRTRTSGGRDFAQFHVWVDPDMTVARAHDVMDEVEAALMQAFPGTEILIHPDPAGHRDDIGYVPSETVEHRP